MDAVIDLIQGGNPTPTSSRVAARAAVARRTIFRHFDGVDDLYCQAVDRHLAEVGASIVPAPAHGPLEVRIAVVVRQRRWLFEEIGPVLRASYARVPAVPALKEVLDGQRGELRRQWVRALAPELDGRGPLAPALLGIVETVSGWPQWSTLRDESGQSALQAERVMVFLVSKVIGRAPDDPAHGGPSGISPGPTRGSG